MHVQAIFRLIVYDRARRVDHLGAYFKAAMRRQAVHEDRVRSGMREKRCVHLIVLEIRFALGRSSSCPCWPTLRVNGLHAGHRFLGRAQNFDLAASLTRDALGFSDDRGVGSYPAGVATRMCAPTRAPIDSSEWHMLLPSPI